jgi:hypothetical protein
MPEFLHEVVKKREREQEHRNYSPRNYLDELSRQMEESYRSMMFQTSVPSSYATDPSRFSTGLSPIHGMTAVRTHSLRSVDEWIRQNMVHHGDNLAQDYTHSHPGSDMFWVLEEVSASAFITGVGRRHFTYSCSLCGARVICSESIPREAVVNGG